MTIELFDNKTLVQLRILDITGKVLKIKQAEPVSLVLKQDLDISVLKEGMYFLESKQGNKLKEVTQLIITQ